MSAEKTNDHVEHADEHEGMTRKKIWQVFFYLLGITAIEFFIALFLLPKGYIGKGIGNFSYIILTLVKAFYIVAYFMHLKFEKLALKTGITVSLIFIVYFIILMLTEGSYLNVHMN
ncbi:MAG: cytochrome C oxidase subunit IV family protein [Flavobacterium sp.]|nr:cytochrome C oxidase subunit IV family protein [Pedobacter sp.]